MNRGMMEPSDLPPEIFDKVWGFMIDQENDIRALCKLSLVSRQWYAAVSARIYSRWLYDGDHHSISSLWRFLRSVLCSRRIADSVQEVDIRNWTFGLVHERGLLSLSEDDFDLVRNAIRMTGLQRIEAKIMDAIRKADPRPLMALLLANLRNLTTLYAQLPETDIFFAEVLQIAAECRQNQFPNHCPLGNLRSAHLTSAWNYRGEYQDRQHYKLGLNHLWPVFQLPNLQKLSVFDFDSSGASNSLGNSAKTSNVTDLTLVHYEAANTFPRYENESTILRLPDTLALLALPKALRKFSLYLRDPYRFGANDQISNVDLWNCIRQHESCIEHLDIYRDANISPPRHRPNSSYFGSIKGFKSLKSLQIQPEVLLGGCCGGDFAPFHLKDTLPPSLESLTLYGDEGLCLDKTLSQQLRDVMASSDFQRLGHFALEEANRHSRCYENFRHLGPFAQAVKKEPALRYADPARPPHDEVSQACRESGREYEAKSPDSCTKGGKGCRYYRLLEEERLQRDESKLDPVIFAISEYLIRLAESRGHECSSVDAQRALSTEDLDTYELPWEKLTAEVLYPEWFLPVKALDPGEELGSEEDG